MKLTDCQTQEERLELMIELSDTFSNRSAALDHSGSFVMENIKDLISSGYSTLTLPTFYIGNPLSLLELVQLQEKLAEGDGSTALSIGWHMSTIKNLAEKQHWNPAVFKELCSNVLKGSLINAAASEKETGSPTRGGKPQTIAEKKGTKWIINGRKIFTTMSPVLDYFIVSASFSHNNDVGNFLISRNTKGVIIEETWDSIAMRGTGSHDLVLNNVEVDEKYCVEILSKAKKVNGSLLHIPACYLGIAQAAQKEAVLFANSYSPNSMDGPIIKLPNVQNKIGEMELELLKSRNFLYTIARKWDENEEGEKEKLIPELGAAKMVVTNSAIKVVDLAMRVVGASSLSIQSPLQRYYRDVRAGLHNPPMDDSTINLLSQSAIKKHTRTKEN
jgi:alkylation response protein AidB-like acyl-CoA dehydrogenase